MRYLNRLNQQLLAFVSNAEVDGKSVLRFCIVNFHTSTDDIEAMPRLVVRLGRQIHAASVLSEEHRCARSRPQSEESAQSVQDRVDHGRVGAPWLSEAM